MEQYESRLLEQWQDDGPQRKGYRALAEWLNVTMLRREMELAGMSTIGDEAESKYERLQSDDSTIAAEVGDTLRSAGVDIDRLLTDFVSYGSVRTHLKECLDAERSTDTATTDWERNSIEIARTNATENIEGAIQSLLNKDEIKAHDDVTINVSVELECNECHSLMNVDRALRQGELCDDYS
jgi:hypothetical protein